MKRFNLSAWAVAHPALVLFLILAIGLGGFVAFGRLGRAEDPNFTIKNVVVTAIWPGSTAAEMQDQVSDPIEKKLQELPWFDKVQTYTKPGFAAMNVQFRDNTPAAQVPFLFYTLRKKLTDIRGTLPDGLIGPNINDEFGDVDSVLYAMTGGGADYAQIKVAAEALRQRLLGVPGVVKVNLYGVQDEKIFVEFSHAKLATLGIPPQTLFDSLGRQNAVVPAGTVETGAQRVPVRVTGALDGARAVAETPVQSDGRTFRLGDIATVSRGYEDPARFLVRQRGEPALGIGVVMAKGSNILSFGRDVQAATDGFMGNVPQGIEVERIADQPHVVDEAIWEFEKSFLEALGIVLVVSFLSLGWRTGIVVALSVPLVLGITFIVMMILGIDLHRITLGALIIALGLLVDDAIIAAEMMVVKMEEGWDRVRAAAFAWTSTAFPMLTGTLVTAAGFLPVGFANSAVGEYAGGIFWVVAIALVASWFVAVIFTPYLGVKLLPKSMGRHAAAVSVSRRERGRGEGTHASASIPGVAAAPFHAGRRGGPPHPIPLPPGEGARSGAGDSHGIYDTRLYRSLRAVIRACVRFRLATVLATVGIFVAAIVAFGNVQQQFFPLSERPELFFQMRLPEGTAIGVTAEAAGKAERLLGNDPDIATHTTYIGQGSPRFWLGLNPQLPNEAFAEIVIVAKDVEARERIKARVEAAVAEGALSEARVRVDRFNFGPPVGFPVQFRVVGPDPGPVREIAGRVREAMRENPQVVDPHLDWNEMTPAVRLVVDQERARALGLDPQDISQTLQTLLSGRPVTVVRDGTERVEVIARATQAERLDLGRIGDLTLVSRNGVPVPLAQVGRITYEHEEPILWRRNRDMAITVRADVVDGVQPPDVTMAIWPTLQGIQAGLAPGYRLEIGGAVEESAKGNASLFALFPIMAGAMLLLLMIQLQSFSRLFLVFMTAPLGIIGASLALNLSGKPFGFVALLGLIALAGMIMRNAVILVDQIETDVEGGSTRREAIVEATVRRARPVVLTALAAILAMWPLSSSAFWGPMAFTIMGGLFVATFLTLLFLPALYALWFRKRLDERGSGGAEEDEEETSPAELRPALPMAAE